RRPRPRSRRTRPLPAASPRCRRICARCWARPSRNSPTPNMRRERLLGGVMERANVDHVVIVTWQRVGNGTEWVTGWPGWVEAITVFRPGERMAMFIEYYNHIPLAQRMARNCDVHWCEDRGVAKAIEELKRRDATRIGVIGPLLTPRYRQFEAAF